MSWSMVKFDTLCHRITDGSHNPPKGVGESEFLMLSSKNVFNDDINFSNPRYLTQQDFHQENKRTDVCVNDVLLTIVGTIGRVAVVNNGHPKFVLQRSVAVLKPIFELITPRFLMYTLQSLSDTLEEGARGVAQKGIYLKQIRDLKIPLPPLPEQQKIAEILDAADSLRQKDRQLIEHYTALSQSLFLEMFGDPVTNPKGWDKKTFFNVFNTKTGKLDSNAASDTGIYPFFTCAKDELRIDSYSYDDEVLLLAGNNAAGIFDVKHYKGKFDAYQRTYILTIQGNELIYSFMQIALEKKLKDLQRLSIGSSTQYLTMKILGRLEFIVPPITLQNEFAERVNLIEAQKQQAQASLEKSNDLFNSLLQRAFKGELTRDIAA
jgi:type I restriction enzyme S subunit